MNGNVGFLGYSVREMSFSKNDYFKGGKVKFTMNITKNSTYLDNNRVRMNLNVKLFDGGEPDRNYPFTLSFVLTGLFQYRNTNILEDGARDIIEKQMIDVLYPYIRMVTSSILVAANVPPVFLPLINVNELLKKNKVVN